MAARYRVISIGTLAAHPLWNERGPVRTPHTTTTLVSAGSTRILVDPGLPPAAVAARLSERAPVRPDEITHVFLTSFETDHRRGLEVFGQAEWLLSEPELTAARTVLAAREDEAGRAGDDELAAACRRDLQVMDRCAVAPDKLAAGVDLFPLPGVTPGTCGLILSLPAETVLIAGDAVASVEHVDQAKVLPGCLDVEQAQESLREALEIADAIVPGRDNVIANPARRLL